MGIFDAIFGGISDNITASSINDGTREIISKSKKSINSSREACGEALQHLGTKKAHIMDNGVKNFLELFGQLKSIDFRDTKGRDELSKFRLDEQDVRRLHEMSNLASLQADGTFTALGRGALAAYGTATVTSATLTFLGLGGALGATGGAGAVVLGGLVTLPALMVLGVVLESNGIKNVNNAFSNLSQAQKFREEMRTAASLCNGIRKRANMFEILLMRLNVLLSEANNGMRQAINTYGTDYRKFSDNAKKTVAMSASLAKAVKTILDTPILTEDGKLTPESLTAANSVRAALPA